MEQKKLTFREHLGELRRALIVSGVALIICFAVGVVFSDYIDVALRLPIKGLLPPGSDEPVYLGIFEPIFYRLKLGLIGGIFAASPIVFWQIWWFISPGLYQKERRMALPFIFIASLFFLGGAAFCYFIVLPKAAAFSIGQVADNTKIILSLRSYLSNASMFILAFGLVFETPVIVFLISWIGLVSPKTLGRYRKYVLLGAFIIAAVITPTPDAINQSIMALPIYILYELGMLAARIVEHRRKKRRKKEEQTDNPQRKKQ
ncbi:MAG: twin-arginine translocase subunit TatC [Deltaproteobacteria bacterium]|nr:twin-arginine translocase subunit TatC [Deltaproteobacteria bacterium]